MSTRLTQWTKNLKTGHPNIDEQHQGLFKKFDELIAATLQDEGIEEVKSLISFLTEYTDEHFLYEIKYYQRKNYPEISSHRQEHEVFIQNLREIKRAYHNDKDGMDPKKLNELLGQWFRGHILEKDLGAIQWINDKDKPR